jgi:hypothetical protein
LAVLSSISPLAVVERHVGRFQTVADPDRGVAMSGVTIQSVCKSLADHWSDDSNSFHDDKIGNPSVGGVVVRKVSFQTATTMQSRSTCASKQE